MGMKSMLLVMMVFVAAHPVVAGSDNAMPHGGGGCHRLMTVAECIRFKADLAGVRTAEARNRMLAQNQEWMREREAACRCDRAELEVVVYPSRRDAGQQAGNGGMRRTPRPPDQGAGFM